MASSGTFTKIYEFHSSYIELTISYIYDPGYPASGPSYSCGGEPGEPASCEIRSVKGQFQTRRVSWPRGGKDGENRRVDTYTPMDEPFLADGALLQIICSSEEIQEDLLEAGEYNMGPDPDAAYEAFRGAQNDNIKEAAE